MFWRSALFAVTCFVFVSSESDNAYVCVTDATAESAQCEPEEIFGPDGSHIIGCFPRCHADNAPGVPEEEEEEEKKECKAPATCLDDGLFAPVQCKGDMFTGRCFCSDEDGDRIFGQMWRSEAGEMTCACSRRRAELEAQGRSDVSLHCTSTGDYEPLQCDDGLCWCADPRTGQPTIPPVPQESMEILTCYSASIMGEQYLRRCESLVHALGVIGREQSEHGTNFLGNPNTFCDYDGSYGPYQIQNGIAYCTDKEGEILGAWQSMSSEMDGMNCNCARDTMMYFPQRGMTVTDVCQGNGNYRPNQNVGDVYYCVDTDGYYIELLEEWPEDNCASYA